MAQANRPEIAERQKLTRFRRIALFPIALADLEWRLGLQRNQFLDIIMLDAGEPPRTPSWQDVLLKHVSQVTPRRTLGERC
jgi:hypothetical protein